MVELYILLVLMILGAIIAIHTKDMLSAVISVGVVGLALCIAFLYLQAPDLAITQIVVEVIAVVVLIRITAAQKDLLARVTRKEILEAIVIFLFFVVFGYFSYIGLKEIKFGEPVLRVANYIIENGLKQVRAGNLVMAIVFDYRGYDTLGEATILFTAVLGTVVILREVGRRKEDVSS